jgi:predicted acylesterase/phospholipase RssA
MASASFTISFSGAGHLLSYHLGVARSLLQRGIVSRTRSIAGSSSGSIAATLLSLAPGRLEEFWDRFLASRGKGFAHLGEILLLEDDDDRDQRRGVKSSSPQLFVCATNSCDGSPHLFQFNPHEYDKGRLLNAIQASCRIPVSFHPVDLFKDNVSYQGEGIEIDGNFYVDGGLSGTFPPPTPFDTENEVGERPHRILVSPISVRLIGQHAIGNTKQERYTGPSTSIVCPANAPSRWSRFFKTRDGLVAIEPSLANLQSLVPAAGFASTEALRDWHMRGMEDAERFCSDNKIFCV